MNDENTAPREPDIDELSAEIERLRAEKETLQIELEEQKTGKRGPFPWRNLLAWILVILAFVTAVAAPLASWSHDYLLDTDRFVETVAPLIKEDAVAQAISERAANEFIEGLKVEDLLEGVLPDEIVFIAGPIANGVETLAQTSAKAILTSDQSYWIWERILRFAHSSAVDAVRGEGALEVTGQGDIVLDLGELLQNLKEKLVASGLDFLEKVPVPRDAGIVVLFTAEELGIARGGVHLIDTLNWILPALALLFFAAAVILSTDRRRFLMISGIGIALAMAISLLTINFTENHLLGRLEAQTNFLAAELIWNKVFQNLVRIQAGILALGVVVAAGSAVAGPYEWAVWLRGKTAHLFESWQDRRQRGVKEAGPVGSFVEAHKMALRVGGLVLIVFILLLLPHLTATAVIVAAIALLVCLVVIELLRAPIPGEAVEEEKAAAEDSAGASESGEGQGESEKEGKGPE
jgi:ABC-type multidrug transport system fused ATPase/permease subunit